MTTYPLATLACTISSTGISAPSFADILASLQASYQAIYGSDVVLTSDTQDGQWLAVLATALNDCNAATIAAYQSFSPSTAQGAGLSSVVKINGLQREVPSNSTADLLIVGVAGTTITNGVVGDGTYQWALPPSVVIPPAGQITVTATCATEGAVAAAAGVISQIITPTRGWQTVTNPAAATLGAPVESDAALRQRQSVSTSLPAQTPLEAVVAAVANVSGVQAVQPYENDGEAPDGNGVPAHSISLVVEGGDDLAVATAINSKKGPGCGTYGTTQLAVTDSAGVTKTISFFRPSVVRLVATISLKALPGYLSSTGASMQAALSAYASGLPVGGALYQSKAVGAADLPGNPLNATFNITGLTLARYGSSQSTQDVPMAFNELASLATADIVLTVTS